MNWVVETRCGVEGMQIEWFGTTHLSASQSMQLFLDEMSLQTLFRTELRPFRETLCKKWQINLVFKNCSHDDTRTLKYEINIEEQTLSKDFSSFLLNF